MINRRNISGFYYLTFHPEAHPESKWQRHYLPQVELKSHTTILSQISRTVLTQTFTNLDQVKAIKNARFTFPLYDGISVVGFTCRVGERVIEGQVKENERAKADFDHAFERGEVAGLLEQLAVEADVFTTTVGNIPPGATIVSEITYIGELKHDAEVDGIRFTIPTAIAPRYGQYPGELLGGPDSVRAVANSGIEIVVDAIFDDGSPISQLRSTTHPIAVSIGTISTAPAAEPTMTRASATLSLGTAELYQDFVLHVVAKDIENPSAILENHPHVPQQRALMATLVPKFSLPPIRPEIVFICDRSGSMRHARKIFTVVQALKIFLKSLPIGVRFNICSFGSKYDFLWPTSQPYSQESLDEAIKYVETFIANYGGTEILPPLQATIENRHKDVELELMLLTDGDVHARSNIFDYLNEQIQEKKQPVRVFTLGVGRNASSALVEGIARAGNGFHQAVGEVEKMDTKIVRMLKGALTPHITDYSLEVRYTDQVQDEDADDGFELVEKVVDSLRVDLNMQDEGPQQISGDAPKKPISLFDPSVDLDVPELESASSDGQDRYENLPPLSTPVVLQVPSRIPTLYSFSRCTVYLLLSPNSTTANRMPTSVILHGTSFHGPLELEIPVKVASENNGKDDTIHRLAARKAVAELEEGRGWLSKATDTTGTKLKEKMAKDRWDELVKREAVRLGLAFQVVGKWCSFVALEQGSEKEDMAMREGWEYLDVQPELSAGMRPHPLFRKTPLATSSAAVPAGKEMMSQCLVMPLAIPRQPAFGPAYQFALPPQMLAQQQYQAAMFPTATARASKEGGVNPSPPMLRDRRGFAAKIPMKGKKKVSGATAGATEVCEPPQFPPTPLQLVVMLQTFEGFWELDEQLLRITDVDAGRAKEAALGSTDTSSFASPDAKRVAATLVAVAFLKLKLADEEGAWELVVEKAEAWLRDVFAAVVVGEEVVGRIRRNAEALVQGVREDTDKGTV